jgi:hypothetical protein
MEGKFRAKINEYGITLTQAGKPQCTVSFKVKVSDTEYKNITWYGSLNEGGARDITVKALITMGYKENLLEKFSLGEGLNIEKEFSVEIIQECGQDGKYRTKIKWINDPSAENQFQNKFISKQDAVLKTAGINLGGYFIVQKKEEKKFDPSDIPF